jgi:hypothetical protein
MYRLMTKESREAARSAWIGEHATEKYRDIEILTYEKEYNGVKKYTLTIWRGSAGNPYINYLCRTPEDVARYIATEKKQRDAYAQYYIEHPRANGKVQSESAKAALNIRNILKREYPKVKFSVTSDNFAGGNSVDIRWTDGVPSKEIDAFARQFEYGTFDGMTDSYNYDNKADHPQAKYVHCSRNVSQEKNEIIQKQLADLMGIENDDYAVVPNDFMVNVRGYAYSAPLSAFVYQIAVSFDFTKGFTGVRKQKREGVEVSNLFELF